MPNESEMQQSFARRSRCPRCEKLILFTHTYEHGGKKRRTLTEPKDPAAVAECPRCHGNWFYFERPATIEVVKGNRSIEPAFSEALLLDNAKGATALKRTHTISREWSKTISLVEEEIDTKQAKLGLSIEGVGLETLAEQAIRSELSLSEEEKHIFSDALEFEVPAATRRRVTLTFNHNWQHGTLILTDPESGSVQIPYKVVDSLTMDVIQEDEAA